MSARVAINGFGRIGRMFFRAAMHRGTDVDIVALNDLTDPGTLALLLRFDSIHGRYPGEVEVTDDGLRVDGRELRVLAERDPAALPWKELEVDVVVESTGFFTKRDGASKHLEAGAKKVVISAPASEPDVTLVLGVNEHAYDPTEHHIISNASCTTNCVVPMAKILHESVGIERGFMTTIHAYTNDQGLHDQPHSDPRRARAAALSIVPTSTGAARAASLALPELEGRLDGLALRVPVPNGSLTDLVVAAARETTVDEVNDAFRAAAEGPLAGIVEYTEDPLVSVDVIGNPHSCVLDSRSTMVSGDLVKVLGWYDNEWGYSCRLAELVALVADRL